MAPEWVGFWVSRFLAVRIAETKCGNPHLNGPFSIKQPALPRGSWLEPRPDLSRLQRVPAAALEARGQVSRDVLERMQCKESSIHFRELARPNLKAFWER